MENIDNALREIELIVNDACDGKLTEAVCRERLAAFKAKYGDSVIHGSPLGDIKHEPASKAKLRRLQIKRAQGCTSEEMFLEMARTGRKLQQKKTTRMIATVAAIIAAIALVAALVSALKH